MITYLHGAGRDHAEKWLEIARSAVGRLETIDLLKHFFPTTDEGVTFRSPITAKRPAAKRGVRGSAK